MRFQIGDEIVLSEFGSKRFPSLIKLFPVKIVEYYPPWCASYYSVKFSNSTTIVLLDKEVELATPPSEDIEIIL